LSFVTIWSSSFRSLVVLPLFPSADPRKRLAFLLAVALAGCLVGCVAGCGGGDDDGLQTVTGSGYRFQAPSDADVVRAGRSVTASDGEDAVSVTLFTLDRPYRPALWRRVRRELDGVTAALARKLGARVVERRDGRIGGRRARIYRLAGASDRTSRLAFVLEGRREYQLLCRGEAPEPCERLLASFRLT
jgi:hypothetical protein